MDLKAFTPGNGNKNFNPKTSFLFHLTDGGDLLTSNPQHGNVVLVSISSIFACRFCIAVAVKARKRSKSSALYCSKYDH